MADTNIIIIIVAFVVAIGAIYILYSIILFQGGSGKKGDELQLSTKNILDQVEVLFDKKEYALVQLLATKYLDRVPSHIDVRIYLAKAYFEDRKYNQAIRQCLTVLKKRPDDLETRKVLGSCYIRKQATTKAIKEYEYLFEHSKNDKDITRTLAELYRETDQLYSSISIYEVLSDLLDIEDEVADVQSILAELNEQVKDYPAAFEAYKRRLGIYPNDVDTNRKLTELYIKNKNYPVAIETLLYMLTFVTDGKNLLWVYETLVSLYVESEDYEKAIEYSEKLLDIQGSDKFKVRNDIAAYNIKLNRLGEGIAILEDLAMMSQNGFDVTLELADAYIHQKEYQKALEKYTLLLDKATPREAKTVNLLLCELYIKWAVDMSEQNKFDESFEYLKNATQYNTLNPEIYYNVAKNNYKKKDFTACVEAINKALEYDKQNEYKSKYLLMLSEAHHQLGNFFEEKKALTDLLKYDDKNPEGLYRVGLMYTAQHDIKNAEDAFKRAILYNPELIQAKYNLALLYESNNRDKAKELYMEVLEQDPTFEEAKNALADLSTSDFF